MTGGVATLPLTPLTALTAGGHTFTAAFAPAARSAFIASTVTTTANYGVVDTTVKSVQAPGSDAKTLAGISANWDYSAYSSAWVKTATGNIAVNGQTFALTGGTATYDSGAAVIDFTGSIRVLAYPGIADAWVQLTDPSLAVDASGAGAWSATVTTSAAPDARGTRLVVATLTGAVLPTFGTTGSTSYSLDFAGTTAPGTWSVSAGVAYTNAWSNAFVLQVPTSIRAFYYSSGTSAAQATKPPSPLAVQWTAAVAPTEPVGTAGSLVWGFKDSWRTYLTMFGATVTAAGGATVGADGLFSFSQAPAGSAGSAGLAATTGPAAEYDPVTGVGTLKYQGSVDFANASHGFDIALQNPWVTFAADGTVVLSAETSTSDTVGLSSLARIDVATLANSSSTTDANGRLVFSNLSGIFSSVLQPGGWSQYQSVATDPVSFSYGLNAPVVVVPPVVTPPVTVPTAPTPLQPVLTGDGTVVAAPVQPVCVAQIVSGATLTWGVKQSFVSYITGPIAKGNIATSGVSAGDGFTWSGGTGTFNASDSRGLVSFGGSVHFTGHAGALDLAIANPRVQILSASSAVLVADVASKALQGSGVNGTVSLASIDLSSASAQVAGGRARWVDAPTTLTASGATAFGGFYTAGQALDSLTISAPLGASTNCDGYSAAAGSAGAAGSLASTGADVTPLWGGLALLLVGVGILSLRRRRRTSGV
ncbi:HtaA domain-containing protein [Subtercola sp. RTI3]|uniref:HtaA domain-containing protein n=1 Tax=Subtercola sp. RTI3 TaxID=3048639 RepID=UPI002B235E10|nr:HtaA domain-containing protein [Subtercola sp. RTI3]MEA9986974.1 HtaA domain-containing protein [Subtercola sp. RTI3]